MNGTLVFERSGRNNFTRVERAVNAATDLKKLGWSKEVVSAAIEKTKSLVGTQDVSLERWVEIARGFGEKQL